MLRFNDGARTKQRHPELDSGSPSLRTALFVTKEIPCQARNDEVERQKKVKANADLIRSEFSLREEKETTYES